MNVVARSGSIMWKKIQRNEKGLVSVMLMSYNCEKCGTKDCKHGVYCDYGAGPNGENMDICTRCYAEKYGWFILSSGQTKKEGGLKLLEIEK